MVLTSCWIWFLLRIILTTDQTTARSPVDKAKKQAYVPSHAKLALKSSSRRLGPPVSHEKFSQFFGAAPSYPNQQSVQNVSQPAGQYSNQNRPAALGNSQQLQSSAWQNGQAVGPMTRYADNSKPSSKIRDENENNCCCCDKNKGDNKCCCCPCCCCPCCCCPCCCCCCHPCCSKDKDCKDKENNCCCCCCCQPCCQQCCKEVHHHHHHCCDCHHIHHHHCCPCCCHSCHCCHCCHPCCCHCCHCCHCKRSQGPLSPSLLKRPLFLFFVTPGTYFGGLCNYLGFSPLQNGPLRLN